VEVDDPVGSPDDDTSYVSETGAFQRQLFTFSAFSISSSAIAFIRIFTRAKYVGSSGIIRTRLVVGGNEYSSGNNTLTASYTDFANDFLTNPDTAAAWTEADVEGTGSNPIQEIGLRHQAGDELRCTQEYILVDYTAAVGGIVAPYYYRNLLAGGM
jgi:hypothetical protein